MLSQYRKRRLENGLRVIGVENRALHLFACNVRVHAGPRFELRRQAGLTHFLEHMLIQGSSRFPTSDAIMRAVEDLGGVLDAGTHLESLEVYIGVHRKHWARALDILTDVILHPLFDEREIEQEKKIVAQETAEHRDERQRNISASELSYSLMFSERLDELGTRGDLSTLETFDRGAVQSHYERFFIPQNVVVSLAGAFDFDETCGVLAGTFGALPAGGATPEILASEVTRRRARSLYRGTQKAPVVDVELSYHAYGLREDRFGPMLAVGQILGGGMSSRLFADVREARGLVYDIWSLPVAFSDTGSLNVGLSVDTRNLVEAVAATLTVVEELRKGGVTPQELERYKEGVRCGMEILCDRPDQLADWLGKQEVLLSPKDLMTPEEFAVRQERLTMEWVREVIRDIFAADNANLAVVGPFGAKERRRLAEVFPAEEISENQHAR